MQSKVTSPFQDVTGLGALKQEWAKSAKAKWFNLAFGVAALLAAPVLLLVAAYVGYSAYNNSGLSRVDNVIIAPLCLAAVALAVGVLVLISVWRTWRLAAALYEHGFAFRGQGPVTPVRWDEIEAVWQAVTKHYTNGIYTGTTHIYTVQTKAGQKLVMDDKLGKDIEVMGRALQHSSATLLFPRYWQSLQLGEKLTFGPLALDRDKLYAGKKELPWSEIMAIKIEKGNIAVKKDKGWFNWASATVPQIPNFFVFYELVGRFAKLE